MTPVPHRQRLLHKLKTVIEPAEAKAHKEEQEFQIKKAQAAGNRGRPRKTNGAGTPAEQ
jgi:hypothetical protein